jgi:hypothetical protein
VICILFCTTNFRENYLVVLRRDIFGPQKVQESGIPDESEPTSQHNQIALTKIGRAKQYANHCSEGILNTLFLAAELIGSIYTRKGILAWGKTSRTDNRKRHIHTQAHDDVSLISHQLR